MKQLCFSIDIWNIQESARFSQFSDCCRLWYCVQMTQKLKHEMQYTLIVFVGGETEEAITIWRHPSPVLRQ